MAIRTPLTVLPASDRARVVCLSGALEDDVCERLARELGQHLDTAARQGQRLVLDLSAVEFIGDAARQALRSATDHLAREPVPVVAAASAGAALERVHAVGLHVYDTLADALLSLPRTPDLGASTTPDTRSEVFGMRAKARTTALIGMAQGMLIERYGLSGSDVAFALLRRGSQHFNLPLRVLASALLTAPPPQTDETWFPGRTTHIPPPAAGFLSAHGVAAGDRRQVLVAALHEAVVRCEADAAEVHLTDPAQDDVLFLEEHHGLHAGYWDQVALVTGPPVVCARAQRDLAPVTVPDVATDPALADHPAGDVLLAAGSRAVHSHPLIAADGHCTGTVTLHWAKPGSWLTTAQERGLDTLAAELAAWRSWYRRTVVLDALEYLHRHRDPVAPPEGV
ncbi:ANTAR domain-containing protein [Streptomyces sp. NPDC057253]|uniref:ANTAR domain-containing protein n=1 Tax=Streptomyces sp. NPDC057253 TaxID=3346069 RepID=UPI003640BFFA